jgi:hypothetical protein
MTDYELVQPFDVDDDSLSGLSPQECFSLGVEWQMFRSQLEAGKPFTLTVLANNANRLTKLAERTQRFVEARPARDGWSLITVGDHVV